MTAIYNCQSCEVLLPYGQTPIVFEEQYYCRRCGDLRQQLEEAKEAARNYSMMAVKYASEVASLKKDAAIVKSQSMTHESNYAQIIDEKNNFMRQLDIMRAQQFKETGIKILDTVWFLRLHEEDGLELLKAKYGIKVTQHKKYPNLHAFKYSQYESDMSSSIVKECRGLILDRDNNWAVVGNVIGKFFNYLETDEHGERRDAELDWTTAQVQEKLDGSLVILYNYNDEWLVATSGSVDASGPVGDNGFDFAHLFWDTHDKIYGGKEPYGVHKDHTYIFELMTPYNQVLVRHEKSRLALLAVRRNSDGFEYQNFLSATYEQPKKYSLGSWEDIQATFEEMDPFVQEGFVAVDGQNRRVKVKSPKYVAMSHLKEGNSRRKLVELIQKGEQDEYKTYFPAMSEEINKLFLAYNDLIMDLATSYASMKDIESQKEFALIAEQRPHKSFLYLMRRGKSAIEILKTCRVDVLLQNLVLD